MKLFKKSSAILLALLTVFSVLSVSFISANAEDFIIPVTDQNATPAVGGDDKPCATYNSETGYWEGTSDGKFTNYEGKTYNRISFFSVVLYDGQFFKAVSEERPYRLFLKCTCGSRYLETDWIDVRYKVDHTCKYVLSGYYREAGHITATIEGVAPPVAYEINVINGTPSSSYAEAGTTVTLEAEQIDGKVFSHWEISGATIADANSKKTSFTMGNADVTAEAIYDDCGCKCHTGNFFYKIIIFFQKIFGINKICEGCGARH